MEQAVIATSEFSDEIGIARALVQPVGKKTFCRIFIPFPHEISIPKGKIVAGLAEISPDSVLTVQNTVRDKVQI